MNPHETWCFNNLQVPCVDVQFLRKTHGIAWPPDAQFGLDFAAYLTTLRRVTPCDD